MTYFDAEVVAIFISTIVVIVCSFCVTMLCCYIRKRHRGAREVYELAGSQDQDDSHSNLNKVQKNRNELGAQNCYDPIVENRLMFMTEPCGGGSRPVSHDPSSLSTIFSSLGDITPSVYSERKISDGSPAETFDDSPLDVKNKLASSSNLTKNFYTLTWVTPEDPQQTNAAAGSSGDNASSHGSSISSKSKAISNHPVHRIQVLRSSGSSSKTRGSVSLTSSLAGSSPTAGRRGTARSDFDSVASSGARSRAGSHPSIEKQTRASNLSQIQEASVDEREISVFETPPGQTNPYFPNYNTPVSANDEESYNARSLTNPYRPPHNTPTQTSGSDYDNHQMLKAVWCGDSSGRNLLTADNLESYIYINHVSDHEITEVRNEQMKLHIGSEEFSNSLSAGFQSLSIHTNDLNNTAIPIHSSTLDDVREEPELDGLESQTFPTNKANDTDTSGTALNINIEIGIRTQRLTRKSDGT